MSFLPVVPGPLSRLLLSANAGAPSSQSSSIRSSQLPWALEASRRVVGVTRAASNVPRAPARPFPVLDPLGENVDELDAVCSRARVTVTVISRIDPSGRSNPAAPACLGPFTIVK